MLNRSSFWNENPYYIFIKGDNPKTNFKLSEYNALPCIYTVCIYFPVNRRDILVAAPATEVLTPVVFIYP